MSTTETDLYELLGVSRDADGATIKSAYRKLAMKHHPDRNPGCTESEGKFKAVSAAYEVLKDPQRRAAYDRFGHAAFQQGGPGGGGHPGADFGDIGDIFETIFGSAFGGGGRTRARRGADLRYDLQIDLEDAFSGKSTEIEIEVSENCETCHGSGATPGTRARTCNLCHGQGQVRAKQGFFVVERPCPNCHGSGEVISSPCRDCRGEGRVDKAQALEVEIPPGVDTGDRIRLSGEGEAGPAGGPPGDLFVQIAVRQHPLFERDGRHLYCEVPISFADAALGGELEVPTLDGRVKLKIPSETQTGKMFRLRSKGVKPVRGGPVGDLLCRAVVETPVNLTKEQRNLLEEFRGALQEGGEQQSPRQSSWFEGVKNFFDGMTG